MSDDTLRAAVIGGGLGGSHAWAYARSPRYDLAAVCDIDPDVMPRFYERAEIPAGRIGEYTDYRLMLERENLDVISVATPITCTPTPHAMPRRPASGGSSARNRWPPPWPTPTA